CSWTRVRRTARRAVHTSWEPIPPRCCPSCGRVTHATAGACIRRCRRRPTRWWWTAAISTPARWWRGSWCSCGRRRGRAGGEDATRGRPPGSGRPADAGYAGGDDQPALEPSCGPRGDPRGGLLGVVVALGRRLMAVIEGAAKVAVVGYPNVGKSSLVKRLTGS